MLSEMRSIIKTKYYVKWTTPANQEAVFQKVCETSEEVVRFCLENMDSFLSHAENTLDPLSYQEVKKHPLNHLQVVYETELEVVEIQTIVDFKLVDKNSPGTF